MSSLQASIVSLGQARDSKKLQEFLDSQDVDKLISLLQQKMFSADGLQLLNYIFRGLSDSGPSQMKRFKITEHVLREVQHTDVGINRQSAIISRISLEVDKFGSSHLMKLVDWCITSIQNGKGDQMSWKEILPKLLSNLEALGKVDHSGTEMTGSQFKSHVVNTLCMSRWSPQVVTSLAGMFVDMPLTPDEHLQVMSKLCKSMDMMDPTEIPHFVNELLHLCKNIHGLPLFLHLQQYFTAKLYSQSAMDTSVATQSSLADDRIETDSTLQLQRAESTVLFFINQSAMLGHNSIKDLIRNLKNFSNAPELVLNPFLLSVLLSVSCVPSYEEQIFQILKSTFSRMAMEEEKRSQSAWIRNVTPLINNVDKLLISIVENSKREREKVKSGLVNLGFALLSATSVRGKEILTERLWDYGKLILVTIMRKQHDVASSVLHMLYERIIIGKGVLQYTDCLLKLTQTVPLLMNDCQNIIVQLLDQLLQLPGEVSQEVVKSLLPLSHTFPSLRDTLILALRKSLYSCNVGTRQMAVKGFLLLLKTLDIRNLSAVSQCSQSTSSTLSYSSQVFSQRMDNSEAIGLELLAVLKRCFVQQVEVRQYLYKGMYDAICRNPTLHPLVLDFLLDHFRQFYKPGEDTLPPLDFFKAVVVKDVKAVVQEPMENLVFVLQQVLSKATSVCKSEKSKPVSDLEEIVESLSSRMIKCSLEDFGLDDCVNLTDMAPENQQMFEIFKQILGVFEALMCYAVGTWTPETADRQQRLVNLFKAYGRLMEFLKLNNKASKKGEGEGAQGPKKKKAELANRTISTILDLKTIIRLLQLLFERPLSWATTESANMLKGRREFSHYVMHATVQRLNHVRGMKRMEVTSFPALLGQCTTLGRLLYQQCIVNFEDLADADKLTSVLVVECFYELLLIASSHYKPHFCDFLRVVAGRQQGAGVETQLKEFCEMFQSLFAKSVSENDDEDEEPGVKKLPLLLVNIVTVLAKEIPHSTVQLEIYNWVKKLCSEKTAPNQNVGKGLVSLLFSLHSSHWTDGILFDNMALQLVGLIGAVDTENEPEAVTHFAVLQDSTRSVCLQQLCNAVKCMLDAVNWVIVRLKAKFSAITHPSEITVERKREDLKNKERDVCRHLSHCVKITSILARIAIPPGPMTDVLLKLLFSLYATLNGLTKYFILRSSKMDPAFQAARFTSVVHLAGGDLANNVQYLLLYVMSSGVEDNDEGKKKKKKGGNKNQLNKLLKDPKSFLNIVFGIETFEKLVIQLSNKCKVNLIEKVKLSASRDFRIKLEVLQQALVNGDEADSGDSNVEENDGNEDPAVNSEPPAKKQRSD